MQRFDPRDTAGTSRQELTRIVRPRIQASADVDQDVALGDGTSVWHLAQVRAGARLGRNVVVGRGAYIGPEVQVGDNCKIQNLALVYEPAKLEDGVFIGPAVVLTNDEYPRAITPAGRQKDTADWSPVGVLVRHGASVGARSVCVAPVTVGRWSLVAAGSVVIEDVADFALVAGVPARRIGWVGKAGLPLRPLPDEEVRFVCPQTGAEYQQVGSDELVEVTT